MSLITLFTNSLGLTEGFISEANSLGILPTNSLFLTKLQIFFLLLCNQVEETSLQSISLTNLNLSTIKLSFMSNPKVYSPIRPMHNPHTPTAQERAQQIGPPPLWFTGIYTHPSGGRTCSFVPQTPVSVPPPPTTAPRSSYTIEGVVYNTRATK